MADRRCISARQKHGDFLDTAKSFVIHSRNSNTHVIPLIKKFQFFVKHCGLERIKPRIIPENFMLVLSDTAVVSKLPRFYREILIIRNNHSRVSIRSQILPGVKTKAAKIAECSDFFPAVFGPVRLTCVFDDLEVVRTRNPQDRVHIRGLAIEMHRDNRFCMGPNPRFKRRNIKISCFRIYVNEHRGSSGMNNRACGCNKRRRDHNSLVSRLYVERSKRQKNRIGAVCNSDGEPRPEIARETIFKYLYIFPSYKT